MFISFPLPMTEGLRLIMLEINGFWDQIPEHRDAFLPHRVLASNLLSLAWLLHGKDPCNDSEGSPWPIASKEGTEGGPLTQEPRRNNPASDLLSKEWKCVHSPSGKPPDHCGPTDTFPELREVFRPREPREALPGLLTYRDCETVKCCCLTKIWDNLLNRKIEPMHKSKPSHKRKHIF